MSIRSWLAKRKIRKVFRNSLPQGAPIAQRRAQFGRVLDKMTERIPESPSKRAVITPLVDAPIAGEWVYDQAIGEDAPVILFLHGGGYVWGAPRNFRDSAWRYSTEAGARILVLDYPLAPQHVYPAQLDDALRAMDYLKSKGIALDRTAIVGDSAGGNLALALTQALVGMQRVPAALGLVSPWLDLTGSGDSITRNARSEAMLDPDGIQFAGTLFAGDTPVHDPKVSPLFGAMKGLPPTLIQVAHDEILLDDSVRAHTTMRDAGVEARLDVWKGVYHDWPQTAKLVPEGRKAIRDMAVHFAAAWT